MIKIKIITADKVKEKFVLEGESKYLRMLAGSARVELIELRLKKNSAKSNSGQQIEEEALSIRKRIGERDLLIVLSEEGTSLSSKKFASFLENKVTTGSSTLTFVIGSAYGIDSILKEEADLLLSLSKFTFPYQLSRLVLIEQLYRVFSIMRGEPYHK